MTDPSSLPAPYANGLRSRAAIALGVLVLLVAIPYAIKVPKRLRLLTPLAADEAIVLAPVRESRTEVGEKSLDIATEQSDSEEDKSGPTPLAEETEALPLEGSDAAALPIDDPGGHALAPFYRQLHLVERATPSNPALARISYYGDSIVAADLITGTLRRKFQRQFGDGGHGYVLMANAWLNGYFHRDIVRFATPGWQVSRVVGPFARDGLYGLGGVSFRSESPGVFSRFSTTKPSASGKETLGSRVSRFVVNYLEFPEGGTMQVSIDGVPTVVETRAERPKAVAKVFDFEDGSHEFEVRALGANVRTFGVWLERKGPGVVVDALGIQGCRIRFLDQLDDAHWADELQLRAPSLVAFQFGMNESEDGELYPLAEYERTMTAVLKQVRSALPDASCLLVGPMDRADKTPSGYKSRPVVPKLADIQRSVAAHVGCAYWDTLKAMGGFGAMAQWHRKGLASPDLTHPSHTGAEVLANGIYASLSAGFQAYKAALPAQRP